MRLCWSYRALNRTLAEKYHKGKHLPQNSGPTEQIGTAQMGVKRSHFLLITLFGAVAVTLAFVFRDALSFDSLAQNREALLAYRDSHYITAVLAFLGVYIAIVAFSLPGATVATLAGGFLFGILPGVFFNVAGATIGASCLFLAARWGLGDWLSSKMDASAGRIKHIKSGINDNQWSMLFLIRFLPIVPFFVANLLPAFVGVPLYRFVVSTGLGIIPGTLVFTSIGSGLGGVFARGETPDFGVIFEPQILGPILGLAALALAPVIYKGLKRTQKGRI